MLLSVSVMQVVSAQISPSLDFNEFDIPFQNIGEPTATMLVTPDNQSLFFRAIESQNQAAIYRTLISNPAAVERVSVVPNSNSINGTDFRFAINTSGSHLVYTVQAGSQNLFQLYSYNIATRQNVRLSGIDNAARPRFLINEDGDQVVFIERNLDSGIGSLQVAPINGNGPARELAITGAGQSLGTSFLDGDFFIAEGSQRVLYYLESNNGDQRDLYSVNLAGSPTPVKLNSLANIVDEEVDRLQLFNSDTQVVYRATDSNSDSNLFSVPVDASAEPIQISEQQTDILGVRAQSWFIDNLEQRVIYLVGNTSSARLMSSTISNTPSHTRLDTDVNQVINFGLLGQITQTNEPIYLSESPPDSGLIDLYKVGVSGGTPQKINDDGTEVSRAYFASGSTFLYTRQQRSTADDFQFQLVRYDASTDENQVLTQARPYPTSFSAQFIVSPNERFIYLGSNVLNQGQFDLFQVPLAGSSQLVRVNEEIPNDHLVDLNTIVINDSLIVYRHSGPDGIATPYFVNREFNNGTFFVLQAENGNTFVIEL